MTRDEIKQIANIVGGDDTYRHFVHRINKEFELADQDHNAQVKVIFEYPDDSGSARLHTQFAAGFCVIGMSSSKMAVWNNMFIDEGWVDESYKIDPRSLELMYMYIKTEYRNSGFGKKLLSKAFDHAKTRDTNSIYAYVSDRTNQALEFYKQMNANVLADFSDEGIYTAFVNWKLN